MDHQDLADYSVPLDQLDRAALVDQWVQVVAEVLVDHQDLRDLEDLADQKDLWELTE